MKHIQTFEGFVLENKLNEINREDKAKADKLLTVLKNKIKNSVLYKEVSSFILMNVIDPYSSFKEIASHFQIRFPDLTKDKDIQMALESFTYSQETESEQKN